MTLIFDNDASLTFTPTGEPIAIWGKGWIDPGIANTDCEFFLKYNGVTVDKTSHNIRNVSTNNVGFALEYASSTPVSSSATITLERTGNECQSIQDAKIIILEEITSSSSAPMDLYFGFIIFILITFFLTWLFRTKKSS